MKWIIFNIYFNISYPTRVRTWTLLIQSVLLPNQATYQLAHTLFAVYARIELASPHRQ